MADLRPLNVEPAGGEDRAVRIVVLPGDGIGPEVTRAAIRVLDAVAGDLRIEYEQLLIGGAAIEAYGAPLRQEDLRRCRDADAVLLGAVGGPAWDHLMGNNRPERGLLRLRSGLGVSINLRPVQWLTAGQSRSPLKQAVAEGADIAFIRELTGGVYFGEPSYYHRTLNGKYALDTAEYTEKQVLPVVEFAFELARRRRGKVTSVDKANVMSTSRLWRDVVMDYAGQHTDVEVEHALVDSFAMAVMQDPRRYDVVVTENLFGDILTDLAGVIAGSLGVLPSASLRPGTFGRKFGLYEPIHGSAPAIAGKNIANPAGCILSIALMLEWSLGRPADAKAVRDAVSVVMESGTLTADLADGNPVSTDAFTDAVLAHLDTTGGTRGRQSVRHNVA